MNAVATQPDKPNCGLALSQKPTASPLGPGFGPNASRSMVPHFPGGVITPSDLRKIADLCERFPEAKLRLSGELIIGGIADPAKRAAAKDFLAVPIVDMAGASIRPVKICSGGYVCENNLQDSFALGLKLDRLLTGRPLPAKMTIAVAGCGRNCSEPLVKDIGIVATPSGYSCYVGGAAGAKPRIAQKLADQLNESQVLALAEKIVTLVAAQGKPHERLGKFIERTGWDQFKAEILAA